ncbi:hypothetical protein [Clostridium saccharobutylicum]|uniref:Uncharacterized protein n=1 Tax=Clostridium saccharobutylicum TaxID=169679 RepID=A0A1S8MZ03_CLOSA|nr:hypothetical protein [Clostridium saccharobutylicum]OOM09414.1 hypothetical protein CLOSAC_36950 [Clostridium saccharobutylicum]
MAIKKDINKKIINAVPKKFTKIDLKSKIHKELESLVKIIEKSK